MAGARDAWRTGREGEGEKRENPYGIFFFSPTFVRSVCRVERAPGLCAFGAIGRWPLCHEGESGWGFFPVHFFFRHGSFAGSPDSVLVMNGGERG
jgi:hypothetical protein